MAHSLWGGIISVVPQVSGSTPVYNISQELFLNLEKKYFTNDTDDTTTNVTGNNPE